ncbi:hypothetical protein BGX21_003249 [Mortierella sp. AD011]|nr:hypothetical protein BGX21_003249 [Mortierella sp. AD011]
MAQPETQTLTKRHQTCESEADSESDSSWQSSEEEGEEGAGGRRRRRGLRRKDDGEEDYEGEDDDNEEEDDEKEDKSYACKLVVDPAPVPAPDPGPFLNLTPIATPVVPTANSLDPRQTMDI